MTDPGYEIWDGSIYDHPKYYDLVFGADCAAESAFILECADRYCQSPSSKVRLFEPACGTGRLLWFLSRRGYSVAGLDLNAAAVAYCNDRFERRGEKPPAWVADMSDFRSPRRFDVAFNTINSFRHLTTASAAKSHMDAMAAAVRPGGLYLLGVHLTPTAVPPSDGESWSARRGHVAVNTHMWFIDRDSRKRIERFGIYFDIHRPVGTARINDVLVLRSYTRLQMNRFLQSCKQWQIVQTYDFAYDMDLPITVDDATEDVVYVLRRTDSGSAT